MLATGHPPGATETPCKPGASVRHRSLKAYGHRRSVPDKGTRRALPEGAPEARGGKSRTRAPSGSVRAVWPHLLLLATLTTLAVVGWATGPWLGLA